MKHKLLLVAMVVCTFGLLLVAPGCDTPTAPTGPPSDKKQKSDVQMTEEEGAIVAELAKLSPEDRTRAEEQKVCPVTGEPLGSMGKPQKITVIGKEVFICCAGCEEKLNEEPEKYLAKIGK